MTNIYINSKDHTIEMTKKFAKAASQYGTSEYNDLQQVRRDYPNYKVITNSKSNNGDGFKGLTYEYMENYIKGHDEDKTIIKDFYTLCGRNENGEDLELGAYATYGEIKEWFLITYPEFKNYQKSIKDILKKTADKKSQNNNQ